jgi:SulP family sulfate permease
MQADVTPAAASPRVLRRLFGDWVQRVSASTLRADLLAGLLGAVLVLPQGIAFATLAGLPTQYGLYTAIVPCVIAALFGSSWHVMSGPTNANSLALLGALSAFAVAGSGPYIEMVLAVTVMVGVVQMLVGGLRLGAVANFISPAALLGFTSGAALLIALHALKDLLGVYPADEHHISAVLRQSITQGINPAALAIGAIAVVVTLAVRRFDKRWPAMLLGLVAATAASWASEPWLGSAWKVHTVGAVGSAWPPFHLPRPPLERLPDLVTVALALTIVALGQAISIAKAVAERSGQVIDANREFLGQGLSNFVGGFFSCYVSCGSLNRSMPNYEAGARTPLASVFSSLLLLALLALASQWLAHLPLAAVGGLLLVIAAALIDVKAWRRFAAVSRTDFWVAAATAAATLTIRIDLAILLGMGLSLVAYLYRTSKPAMRTMGFDTMGERRFIVRDDTPNALPECPQIKLLRMEGSIYFGAASHVADRLRALREEPGAQKHLLVMAKSMNFIDVAGDAVWQAELKARRAMGGDLYFHRPRPQVLQMWEGTGFLDALGRDHLFPDKRSAIAAIYERIPTEACLNCSARSTWECANRAGAAQGPFGDL